MSTPILNLIAQIATQEHVNPQLMQADALVESGGNPGAVGDNGSSFGLFQDHVGGAGGSTLASARQYLDPVTSIRHAAQRFKGATDAEGIYRAQRPADHAGYVAKLNATLGSLGGVAGSPGPTTLGPASPSKPINTSNSGFLLANMFGQEDPLLGQLIYNKFSQNQQPAVAASTPQLQATSPSTTGSSPVSGNPFHSLESTFGLKRSSGDAERPGVHVANSYHYRKAPWGGVQAYDYGNAINNSNTLMQTMQYFKNNPQGVQEAFYDPAGFYIKNGQVISGAIGGHGDHLHVSY